MSTSKPFSAVIVGCGVISNAHAKAISAHPEKIRLVACADIVEEKARAFAATYDVPAVYSDYLEMIDREKPDMVILATWPVLHEEQVLAVASRGIRGILCEKSLAMNAVSAKKMADAAERGGSCLIEGFMWRHHPRTLEARELLTSGRIGNLMKLRAVFQRHALADPAGSWKHRPEAGGGVVFDFCCYCVNAAGMFCPGLPERVQATWQKNANGLVTDLNALLEYPDGLTAIIESSYRLAFLQQIELHGADGILRIGNCFTPGKSEGIEVTPHGKARAFDPHPAPSAVQAECQMLHLCDCLENRKTPRFSAEESVRNHAIIDAMLASAEFHRPTSPRLP